MKQYILATLPALALASPIAWYPDFFKHKPAAPSNTSAFPDFKTASSEWSMHPTGARPEWSMHPTGGPGGEGPPARHMHPTGFVGEGPESTWYMHPTGAASESLSHPTSKPSEAASPLATFMEAPTWTTFTHPTPTWSETWTESHTWSTFTHPTPTWTETSWSEHPTWSTWTHPTGMPSEMSEWFSRPTGVPSEVPDWMTEWFSHATSSESVAAKATSTSSA